MKKKSVLLLVIVLCLSLFAGCGGTEEGASENTGSNGATNTTMETYTIQVAHGGAETTALHQGWLKFEELVEEASQGNIDVQIYGNQQLGGDREAIEGVQLGNITMACPSTAPLAAFNDAFYVLDIPFLFADRDSVYEKLDGEAGQVLLERLKENNIVGLGYWENGFRNLTNDEVPVREPSDLEGMVIRTMENEIHLAAFRELGANPTPMAFGELYTALQQGTVDGQENPYELIYATRFYEVQNYITETQHIYSAYVPIINKDFFESLPMEYKEIIRDSMEDATTYMRELAADNDAEFKNNMQETNEIIELTDDELQAFRDAMIPIVGMVEEIVGEELVNAFIN